VGVIGIEHKEGKGSYVILGEDYSSFFPKPLDIGTSPKV